MGSTASSTGARFGLNIISAVSPRGLMPFMLVQGRVNTDVLCQFIDRFMKGASCSVFLIFDGHPTHRAKKLLAYVESFQGKIRVFYLPAYAPQLNPAEQVWNVVKTHGAGRV